MRDEFEWSYLKAKAQRIPFLGLFCQKNSAFPISVWRWQYIKNNYIQKICVKRIFKQSQESRFQYSPDL